MHYIIYSTLPHYSVGQFDIIKYLITTNKDDVHTYIRDTIRNIVIEKCGPSWEKIDFIIPCEKMFCDEIPEGYYACFDEKTDSYAIYDKTVTETVFNGWLKMETRKSVKLTKYMTIYLKSVYGEEMKNKIHKQQQQSSQPLDIEKMEQHRLTAMIKNLISKVENTKGKINKLSVIANLYNLMAIYRTYVDTKPTLKNVLIEKLHEFDDELRYDSDNLWNSSELRELEKNLNKESIFREICEKEEKRDIIYNILTGIFNPKAYIQFFANTPDPEFIKKIDKNALQKYIDNL